MKHLTLLFFLWLSVVGIAQKTEYTSYTRVELLSKSTLKYGEPLKRNNDVTFDYVNKKITALDTVTNLRNIYIIKSFKKTKTGNFYDCVDENSKMDCTIQTSTNGNQKEMEIVFKNGFKIRFSKP